MYFERIFDEDLAQVSYIVGCRQTGEALIVDPLRDVDRYVSIAEHQGLRITHVTETHIHADYLSGSRELAHASGAQLLLSDEGGPDWQYAFEHHGLHGGDRLHLGNVAIDVVHTPGHTPEHITFIVTDTAAGDAPTLALTGDFVFVGDVGRPDLLEKAASVTGSQETGARQLYQSLKVIRELPQYLAIWPGHGAGSACGKSLGAVPSTTLGYEEATSWAFRAPDEDSFVSQILEGQPEPPSYFGRMKVQNRQGPPILDGLPQPERLNPQAVERLQRDAAQIVDARPKTEYSRGHIPGSLNIQAAEGFSTWAGWTLDPNHPIVLVAPESRMEDLVRGLIRVGLDEITGYLPNITLWSDDGRAVATLPHIDPRELYQRSNEFQIIDVRGRDEWDEGHIVGAHHIHVGHLSQRLDEIPRNRPVALHCRAGDRSTLGASILRHFGYDNVYNVTGGLSAWKAQGLPLS
ncbi:MAG: rhodanese-like domain-containing protein [Alkalispirochaeta sp.]